MNKWKTAGLAIALVIGNVAIAYDLRPKAAAEVEHPEPAPTQNSGVLQFDSTDI